VLVLLATSFSLESADFRAMFYADWLNTSELQSRTHLCWWRWQRRFSLEPADSRPRIYPDGVNTSEL
jgi:hypothetical protein